MTSNQSNQIPVGYSQKDVGIIPDDWNVRKMNDIAISISSGRSNTRSESGDYPLYGSTGVIGFRKSPDYVGKKVLVARVGANAGAINYVSGKYSVSDNTLIVSYKPDVDIRFSYYQLINFKLNKLVFGSGQPLITGSQIKNLSFPFPNNYSEQQLIAKTLDDCSTLISKLSQLIQKKRNIKQGAMQELLTGKRRLPGFSGEWEVKKLGNLCQIKTGKKDVNQGNPKGKYPFFTCSRDISNSDQFSFDCEAILIAGNGEVGNLHYYKGKFEAYQRTYVLSNFEIETPYLWHQMICNFRSSLGIGTIGSTIPYIKKENILNYTFFAPQDTEEQAAIAQVLSDMDADIESLEKQKAKYIDLKQGMMQQLLTGKIRLI